jgi:hypothetical protein
MCLAATVIAGCWRASNRAEGGAFLRSRHQRLSPPAPSRLRI